MIKTVHQVAYHEAIVAVFDVLNEVKRDDAVIVNESTSNTAAVGVQHLCS